MRICYIADAMSIHTKRWVNHFANKGHEVHLISSKFPEGYEGYNKDVQVHRLVRLFPQIWGISGYFSGIIWLFQVRRMVRRIKPDILNAIFIMVTGYLGAISGFHPLVLTALGSDILVVPKNSIIHRFITRITLSKADFVTCVSPSIKQEIIHFGIDPNIIYVTPLGVDTSMFKARATDNVLLQRLDIAGCPVIISTRNLKPLYDIQTLIRAIPHVLKEIPETKFIIAGEGEQKEYLKDLANTLGISDSIRFTGLIPHKELPQYLSSSVVYVSTSLSDGASVGLFEALACQTASVVSDIPANRDWIKDGENGYLIAVGDSKMLADRIIIILKNQTRRELFGKAGRQLVEERADHNKEMDKIEKAYEKLSKSDSYFQ